MSDLPVIVPRDFNELRAFAKDAADSGFFGAKNPVQALMLTMSGRDLGLSYTQALRAFHVVSGRPTMSADGMVAVCLGRKDVCAYFSTIESTPDHAIVETHRVGAPQPQRLTYSMSDAKAAGLTGKDTWRQHPAAMLRARAKAALARDVYPDLLMGLYDPDELGEKLEPKSRVRAEIARAADPEPVVVEVVAPAEHDQSWEADRPGFCAHLRDRSLEYDEVAAYLAHLGKPRPSQMSRDQRAALVGWLARGATLDAYHAWRETLAEPGSNG
jgi:hypothetical protein